MNMINSSVESAAGLILDGVVLFILAGMLIYTSLYRRRGKTEDKLFFVLILTNIAAAVFNGIFYPVSFLAIDAFSVLFCAYHMYRMEWEPGRIKKTLIVLLIPDLSCSVQTDDKITGMLLIHRCSSGRLRVEFMSATGPDAKKDLLHMVRFSIIQANANYSGDTEVIIPRHDEASRKFRLMTGPHKGDAEGQLEA